MVGSYGVHREHVLRTTDFNSFPGDDPRFPPSYLRHPEGGCLVIKGDIPDSKAYTWNTYLLRVIIKSSKSIILREK